MNAYCPKCKVVVIGKPDAQTGVMLAAVVVAMLLMVTVIVMMEAGMIP